MVHAHGCCWSWYYSFDVFDLLTLSMVSHVPSPSTSRLNDESIFVVTNVAKKFIINLYKNNLLQVKLEPRTSSEVSAV